ncbi:MAG TPA: Ppx/GppA family phosphatase, partial [Exiguobacterium sp.]|nr:Ppx/GppA family phosphatase [Exiguobacterium sp.]
MKQELAVIDIGSNSIRYVIFHPIASGRYIEKINIKVVARLSAHINKDGALDDAGISLLEETLHR